LHLCHAQERTRIRRVGQRDCRHWADVSAGRGARADDTNVRLWRRPALVALCLYAIFPVIEATLTGCTPYLPLSARQRWNGFAPRDVLTRIELPLAFPFILAGLRNAVIINIGTAAIARRPALYHSVANHRRTFRVEPGLCLEERSGRVARDSGGPLFCLARGFTRPAEDRRNSHAVLSIHRHKSEIRQRWQSGRRALQIYRPCRISQ